MSNATAKLTAQLRHFADDRSGVTAIEYAVLAAAVAGMIIVSIFGLGGSINKMLWHSHDNFSPSSASSGGGFGGGPGGSGGSSSGSGGGSSSGGGTSASSGGTGSSGSGSSSGGSSAGHGNSASGGNNGKKKNG